MKLPYPDLEQYPKFDPEKDDRIIRAANEMMGYVIQGVMDEEQGKGLPDSTGADYFFLVNFITDDMEFDFIAIEKDFLKHCSARLQEFSEAGWYGEEECQNYEPEYALKKKILRLIYNGAKLEDEYCKELLKYLYRLYHKKEYNQLKRFRKISPGEIFSIAENRNGDSTLDGVGRILGMCRIMNIELDAGCSILYYTLEDKRKEWIRDNEAERDFLVFEEGLFEECLQQIEVWDGLTESKSPHAYRKKYQDYFEGNAFVGASMRYIGFREDYMDMCSNVQGELKMQMARTLAILKTLYPKKEYSYSEVQKYTVLYDTAAAFCGISDTFDIQTGYLLHDREDEFLEEEISFKPENIKLRNAPEKKREEMFAKTVPLKTVQTDKQEYMEEIEKLRREVKGYQQENKALRKLYNQAKKACDESEARIKKFEDERVELIALRNFAYQSQIEEEVTEDTLEDMKQAVENRKIVIIGGHINWMQKLKTHFPEWLFIHTDAYKNVDGKVLEGKEYIYFFTDYMNHASYLKYIAAVREKKIPFGYLKSRNVEQIICQVYEDFEKMSL